MVCLKSSQPMVTLIWVVTTLTREGWSTSSNCTRRRKAKTSGRTTVQFISFFIVRWKTPREPSLFCSLRPLEIESFCDSEDFSEALNWCQELFRSTMKQVLEDADLNMNDIDEIVLEGGSTKVQQIVKDFFGGKATGPISGEEDTADLVLLDVNLLTMGIVTVGGVMTKLGGVTTKLGGVMTKLGGVMTKLEGVMTKLGGVTTKLGGVMTKVGGVMTKVGGVMTKLIPTDPHQEVSSFLHCH
ncbi:78 kDa glucose-regulated protein [Elysia marginata]|uniref:78 kDa glucose-regulated protein n=1 Tax=Elysia marginata TaxID=1093978 RepID=A0AAV4FAZ8_9GAST|nr:78 kDa glucose-regulated protein [Elysia marginata]